MDRLSNLDYMLPIYPLADINNLDQISELARSITSTPERLMTNNLAIEQRDLPSSVPKIRPIALEL